MKPITERELKALVAKLPAGSVTQGPTVAESIRVRKQQATRAVVITLPCPGRVLSPNGRSHWAVKARAVKAMRRAAWLAAKDCRATFTAPVVDVVFWHRTKARRDRDNGIGSLKAAIDGLTDAGLWEDDNAVRWGDVTFYCDKDNARVVLTITERHEQ